MPDKRKPLLSYLKNLRQTWGPTPTRRQLRAMAPLVDDAFYRAAYPDVADAGMTPARHYARFGWREGRDPSPSFSTNGYLAQHPGLIDTGPNPLLHFLETGADPTATDDQIASEAALIADEFDAAFYRKTYEVPQDMDPVEHYCRTGWRAGHDPCPEFSTRHYLSDNIDIRESGVNPFWHYLVAGRDEGRTALHPGGWQYDVIARQETLEDIKNNWVHASPPPKLTPASALAAQLSAATGGHGTLISIGHDDYVTTPGGVQFCIAMEAERARDRGLDYLNIHPYQPLPTLAARGADPVMSLRLNGTSLGHARMSALTEALEQARLPDPNLVVHHLMGQSPECLLELARTLDVTDCHFWLHDNFSVCTSYALQRNNVSYCGAPDIGSNACQVCLYGRERRDQHQRMVQFFETLNVHVIAPSKVALTLWQDKSGLTPRSTDVRPHLDLRPTQTVSTRPPGAKINIAFVGAPLPHKGWPTFKALYAKLANNPDYQFWFFGAEKTPLDITHVPIHCTPDNPTATIDALRDHRIDLVLHWASCRETFSFSTFEAIAAGAFVITNDGSGNVAATVQDLDSGLVLTDEAALLAAAADGRLAQLATTARDRRARQMLRVTYSDFTLASLPEKAAAA